MRNTHYFSLSLISGSSLWWSFLSSLYCTVGCCSEIHLGIGQSALIYHSKKGWKTAWLVMGLITNLACLCYFKYAYFFADMMQNLFGLHIDVKNVFSMIGNRILEDHPSIFATLGSPTDPDKPYFTVDRILLPVGISFFTFQCISYLMDIFREKVSPAPSIPAERSHRFPLQHPEQ